MIFDNKEDFLYELADRLRGGHFARELSDMTLSSELANDYKFVISCLNVCQQRRCLERTDEILSLFNKSVFDRHEIIKECIGKNGSIVKYFKDDKIRLGIGWRKEILQEIIENKQLGAVLSNTSGLLQRDIASKCIEMDFRACAQVPKSLLKDLKENKMLGLGEQIDKHETLEIFKGGYKLDDLTRAEAKLEYFTDELFYNEIVKESKIALTEKFEEKTFGIADSAKLDADLQEKLDKKLEKATKKFKVLREIAKLKEKVADTAYNIKEKFEELKERLASHGEEREV
ncbi:MAG: hypothetical protein IJ371_02540 [Clostridia bacterium]|nr:hypothetical protein [Clostridia bacterium]